MRSRPLSLIFAFNLVPLSKTTCQKFSFGSILAKPRISLKTGFSRFPIYRENINDIVGLVHIKDTLGIEDQQQPLSTILRDILKIRAGMKADDVLREMQHRKVHLAIMQGKDGRTLGLVTLEDLIEEVFGEITDEHDAL